MNIETALRLLQNSGFHVLGTDGSFIYLEDPSCILRSFETFAEYAWVAVSFIAGMLLFGWAISLIRGIKNDLMTNIRNLVLIFGTLAMVGPIINLIYGGDLFARGCREIRVEYSDVERLLAARSAKLSPRDGVELYDNIEIIDTGINGNVSLDVMPTPSDVPVAGGQGPSQPPVQKTTQTPTQPPVQTPSGVAVAAVANGSDVIYTYAGDMRVRRTGGSAAWRNNNPGNIRESDFARRMGAIGAARGFAVFPDLETGLRAMGALLRGGSSRDLSIRDAINRYAPPSENDTGAYQKSVARLSGLDITRRIRELNDNEFSALVNAMRQVEGWKPGREIRL